MIVSSLRADSSKYQRLILENEADWGQFERFDGTSLVSLWKPVVVRLQTEDEEGNPLMPGDFPSLIPYVPVFSQRAIDELRPLLHPSGEILPLRCESGPFFAFNVTSIIDALDVAHSQLKKFTGSDKIMRIVHYSFWAERLKGISIFKLPQLHRSDVYATDEFLNRTQSANLLGFSFREVWNNGQV